mmetsp:Transcript_8798/g.14964  ORF Transcript_8798/g.14964 Transcript_8798/m.14964 type:complete len:206 (-) Transcript_8798:1447-2064(-)
MVDLGLELGCKSVTFRGGVFQVGEEIFPLGDTDSLDAVVVGVARVRDPAGDWTQRFIFGGVHCVSVILASRRRYLRTQRGERIGIVGHLLRARGAAGAAVGATGRHSSGVTSSGNSSGHRSSDRHSRTGLAEFFLLVDTNRSADNTAIVTNDVAFDRLFKGIFGCFLSHPHQHSIGAHRVQHAHQRKALLVGVLHTEQKSVGSFQ